MPIVFPNTAEHDGQYSIERFDLHRFDAQKSANVGVHLLPRHLKLTPIEPRVVL